MMQINLLPWREHAKQTQYKKFFFTMGLWILGAIIIIIIMHIYLASLISIQESRNNFLQTQLNNEQSILTKLSKQKKAQNLLLSEVQFIFSLRENSNEVVHFLDVLARIVPEGIALNKISRSGKLNTISGTAQSNLVITEFMKNIVATKIFKQPELTEISVKENSPGDARQQFTLKVEQVR